MAQGCRATDDGRRFGGSDALCEAACGRLPDEVRPLAESGYILGSLDVQINRYRFI